MFINARFPNIDRLLIYIFRVAGLICAEGNLWREQRKFTASSLKKLGIVKSPCNSRDQLEAKILRFVDETISVSNLVTSFVSTLIKIKSLKLTQPFEHIQRTTSQEKAWNLSRKMFLARFFVWWNRCKNRAFKDGPNIEKAHSCNHKKPSEPRFEQIMRKVFKLLFVRLRFEIDAIFKKLHRLCFRSKLRVVTVLWRFSFIFLSC